jgi:xanthine dehydrogenase accessory factor
MIVIIRGGGDLASGVAYRLVRSGLRVIVTELEQPLAVRRKVSFAEAINAGVTVVEGITARKVEDPTDTLRILQIIAKGHLPVLADPSGQSVLALHPSVIVDARMLKKPPEPLRHNARLFIGLGPGFEAGKNCHAVIETRRGHTLGRVYWSGTPEPDTGLPENVAEYGVERVLRSPLAGELLPLVEIGDIVEAGQDVAEVSGEKIKASFKGVVRGLLRSGQLVTPGLKIGDIDPRLNPQLCSLISDKALAIGGGVLEAILSRIELRASFWS